MDPIVAQLGVNARAAVNMTVLLVNLLDQRGASGIFSLMGTGFALVPGIIAVFGNVQSRTEQLN